MIAPGKYVDEVYLSLSNEKQATYLEKTGGIMRGDISLNNLHRVTQVKEPQTDQDVATKGYVDKLKKCTNSFAIYGYEYFYYVTCRFRL